MEIKYNVSRKGKINKIKVFVPQTERGRYFIISIENDKIRYSSEDYFFIKRLIRSDKESTIISIDEEVAKDNIKRIKDITDCIKQDYFINLDEEILK